METYNYDDAPTAPGFGLESSSAPSVSDSGSAHDTPASPGAGTNGSVTPSQPSGTVTHNGTSEHAGSNGLAAPGFGPVGPVTPALPSAAVTFPRPNGCVNCSGTIVRPQGNVLWTWGVLSPFFSTSNTVAHVRFYNAAASREPMDVYLNGRLVVSNLDYMNYTNYLHIVPGYYRLTVYSRTNPNSAVVDTGVQFRGGVSYTMSILGTQNNYSVQLLTS